MPTHAVQTPLLAVKSFNAPKTQAQAEWAQGLAQQVYHEFGTRKFTYVIYCTTARGYWEELLKRTVAGNPIEVVPLHDIIRETVQRVEGKKNKSVEPTTLGRMVQLLLASSIELPR